MIEGKVARVLNVRELVINRGTEDGVELGMRFDVLDKKGDDISDPETGEPLGSVYRPKIKVEVVRVEPKLAVARTYRSWQENIGGAGADLGAGLSRLFLPPKYVRRYETLKTDEATWEDLDESESFVKTGDPVRQTTPQEDAEAESRPRVIARQ